MAMSLWPTFLAHPAFPLLCNTFESLFLILDRVIVFFSFSQLIAELKGKKQTG